MRRLEGRARAGLEEKPHVSALPGGTKDLIEDGLPDSSAQKGGARAHGLHLAGERDYPALAARSVRTDYRLLPFTDDFGAALSAADLVVARAGGSVWEVAAAGRPALLVPYPHATADHQTENARYFERGGGAVVVPEPDLDLRRQVEELLADPQRLGQMGESMKALARPNAADDIAKELLRLAS